ncbi:hypothetical protein G9A89_012082 [Geosiphon pyriformis]|nr:hypothetical protein G9A89_012082 [Geosiphon pyriformis]
MGDYSYLPQQLEEHFEAHNKNDLDFIELNSLPSCLIYFPIEDQFSDVQDLIEWLDDFERAVTANQYDEKYKFQIIGGYLQGFPATWFSQKTDANAQHQIIR